MGDSKDAADVTNTPKGLDVAVVEPGTIVGARDLQGTDGTVRTDRPGEILGTPVVSDDSLQRGKATKEREAKRSETITEAVDRANREELPKLGGPVDDGWEPGDAKSSKAAQSKAEADAKAMADARKG